MVETIKRYKIFTPDEYDEEENFLREMSLNGWHFKSLNGFAYAFEKGEPKSYCYRLDFVKDVRLDKDHYISLYEDCGWTHIFEFNVPFHAHSVWQYFRIESQTGHEEVLFSDNESKIDMLKRVRRFYTALFAAVFGLNLFNIFNMTLHFTNNTSFYIGIMAGYIFVFIFYVKILFRLSEKISRLKISR